MYNRKRNCQLAKIEWYKPVVAIQIKNRKNEVAEKKQNGGGKNLNPICFSQFRVLRIRVNESCE